MAANNLQIWTKQGVLGSVGIPTATAQVKNDGTSAGTGTDIMYNLIAGGTDGTYLDRVRFFSVASAAATIGVATVLRVYASTVAAPGATTNANTWLIGEASAGAINSSNSINAETPIDVPIGFIIPSGTYVHVSQHVAQTTNQRWNATAIGGNY